MTRRFQSYPYTHTFGVGVVVPNCCSHVQLNLHIRRAPATPLPLHSAVWMELVWQAKLFRFFGRSFVCSFVRHSHTRFRRHLSSSFVFRHCFPFLFYAQVDSLLSECLFVRTIYHISHEMPFI